MIKAIAAATIAFTLASCASSVRFNSSDPRYSTASRCGAQIGIMIFADVTLRLRTTNSLRAGELPAEIAAQVNKQAENHPSAEYLKVIISDIGTNGLKAAVDQARAGVADLMANAKLKHGEDRVLALEELLPRFEGEARAACRDAGYNFSALKSISVQPPASREKTQLARPPAQPPDSDGATKVAVQNTPSPTPETAKSPSDLAAQEKAAREQEANRQRELVDATRKKEAQTKDAAKTRARAMIRAATPQERTLITAAVAKNLFDAESARYGEARVIPQSYACIEVNAKNRFGGYTGFQSMIVAQMKGEWYSIQSLKDLPISCTELITELHIKEKGE